MWILILVFTSGYVSGYGSQQISSQMIAGFSSKEECNIQGKQVQKDIHIRLAEDKFVSEGHSFPFVRFSCIEIKK